jgi:hypothetical protein
MLEYVKAGSGARLSVAVLHDDAKREYAYGPAKGLPNTSVGPFSQEMYDMAKKGREWIVASMMDDWKRIFAFEGLGGPSVRQLPRVLLSRLRDTVAIWRASLGNLNEPG